MRNLYLVFAMLFATLPAFAAEMSMSHKNSLKLAFETGDAFVLEATMQAVEKQVGEASEVLAYVDLLKNPVVAVVEEPAAEDIWRVWSTELWSGSAELGADIQNGNTNRRAFNGALNIKRSTDEWTTSAFLKGKMVREDKVRTEEKYEVGAEADYHLNEKSFVFGDIEYVNDPFSGLEYRLTETFGYGRNVLKDESMKLDLKASLGGRHSQANTQNAERQDEFIFKPSAQFDWIINDGMSFSQKLSSTMGNEVVITESVSALKNKISEDWYFKVAVDVEHLDDVEGDTKHTDTATTLNLMYEF